MAWWEGFIGIVPRDNTEYQQKNSDSNSLGKTKYTGPKIQGRIKYMILSM